jgi:hypothetical protein
MHGLDRLGIAHHAGVGGRVLVVAQQPQSFGAKHDSSYLLGLNPETGVLIWKVMLDKHPATILTQSTVVYVGSSMSAPRQMKNMRRPTQSMSVARSSEAWRQSI